MASESEEMYSKKSSEFIGDSLLEVIVPSSSYFDSENWTKSRNGDEKSGCSSFVLSAPQRQFLLLGEPQKNTGP